MSARASVFEDVGEGLLDDSVGHQTEGLGDDRLLSRDGEGDLHPGLLDELGNLRQPGGGGVVGVGVLSQHPDDATHLDEGLATGLGDGVEDLGGLLRLLRRQGLAALRLHDHDRQ